jgi:hypothetical protein
MAEKHLDIQLIINDLDSGVAAFWDLIANAPEVEFDGWPDSKGPL